MTEDKPKTTQIRQNTTNNGQQRRTKRVDLRRLERQGKTIIAREFKKLLDQSYTHKLDKDDADTLLKYMKYIKELSKEQRSYYESLPTEKLRQIARLEDEGQDDTDDD